MPAKRIPHVDVPLIDKWTHFVLFSGFSLLWLLAINGKTVKNQLIILLAAIFTGCLIEYLQGYFTSLGRSMELMDAAADAIGGLLGIVLFRLWTGLRKKQSAI